MKKRLSHLLSDREGSGMVWFFLLLLILLYIFAAVYTMWAGSYNARGIRREMDSVCSDILSDVRQTAYDELSSGITDYSDTLLTDTQAGNILKARLSLENTGTELSPVLTAYKASGRVDYSISQVHFDYIGGGGQAVTGDLNRDGILSDEDVSLAAAVINGTGVLSQTADLDIDRNGTVNERDLSLLTDIVRYCYANGFDAYKTSYAYLVISFDLTVPVSFNGFRDEDNTMLYTYALALNFVPA